jgi:nucleoside-diphosphate-sugar epimerase
VIALTGYSGFVGSKLLATLSKNECVLLGRGSFAKGYPFCKVDLAAIDEQNVFEALRPVTTVIHAAARLPIAREAASHYVSEFNTINTQATISLAEQAVQAGVKRFIYLSSIKVNGESTKIGMPFTHQDKLAPNDAYASSKADAERHLISLGKQTGMEIVIIRPPLVYGEGVKANFANLMTAVGNYFPLPVRSLKHNKRSLVSVYNLVDLIKVCITHPKAANNVFLVSDDNDLSTAQIVALMAKVQNKNNLALPLPSWCLTVAGRFVNKQAAVDRLIGSLQVDISHTKKTLNWTPPYSLEHGFSLALKRT